MHIELDRVDRSLLALLQEDAGMTTAALAERLSLSQSPCWRRVNRLEQAGLIQRRVAVLNREALGMEIVVFATVNLTQSGRQNLLAFESEMERSPRGGGVLHHDGHLGLHLKNCDERYPPLRRLRSQYAYCQ